MVDFRAPAKAVEAFQSLTGLCLCVHDLSGALEPYLHPSLFWHSAAPCRAAKSGIYAHRCYHFEISELRNRLSDLRSGRIHQCHAGLVECVTPVYVGEEAVAVIFAGQYTTGGHWDPDFVATRSRQARPLYLREIARVQADHYLEALRQLAARLSQWISESKSVPIPKSRQQRIHAYIDEWHNKKPTLQKLADIMSVSPSRVAHLVKEITGSSFSNLVNEARLRTACHLLKHSSQNVQEIALQSGFGDQSNFHKKFKVVGPLELSPIEMEWFSG